MSLHLGTKLADLRKRNGLSQEALAEKMGVSRQAVSKWERGESAPDTDTLIELSRLYSVSLDELVGNESTDDASNEKQTNENPKKKQKKSPLFPKLSKALLIFPFPIFIILFYLIAGFTNNLWHPLWIIFLVIPTYYHLAIALRAKTKKGLLLGLPVPEIALILFLVAGFNLAAWKYAWMLFILVIVYYWLIGCYVKKDK